MSPVALPRCPGLLYINGLWAEAAEGDVLDIVNPADESVVQTVAYGSRADARRALEAAQAAMGPWRGLTAWDRGRLLKRAADLTRERLDALAMLLTLEEGKTLAGSRAEISQAADTLEWFAEEGKRIYSRGVPASFANKRLWVLHQPVGVVAAITPWNFPIMLLARKLAAALAAGCTVVARPASQTPLATMAWMECFQEAGFPPGTVNLVTGPGTALADEFFENPICAKVAFTGSVATGKELVRRSADRLVKLELELGGHAPVLIFPDMEPEEAAETCVVGKFRNMGQVCISPARFYVHHDRVKAFTEAAVERVRAMRLGSPLDAGCEAGPLFEARGVTQTEAFMTDLRAKGGRVLLGGRRPAGFDRGYWYEPTVVDQVTPEMRLTSEETFGPVMPLMAFGDVEEGLRLANATTYGLAAFVLTRDLGTAIRCAEGLEFGVIGINDTVPSTPQAPFFGMKQSGMGRECGSEGIHEYLETKMVSIGL